MLVAPILFTGFVVASWALRPSTRREDLSQPAASFRSRTIAYWVTTGILALECGVGGVMGAARLSPFSGIMQHLGYSAYFMTIIGFWYVLGGVAILARYQLVVLESLRRLLGVGLTVSSKEDAPDSAAPGRAPRSMHTGQNSIAPENSLTQLGQVYWSSVLMGLTVLQPQPQSTATQRSTEWCDIDQRSAWHTLVPLHEQSRVALN